MIQPPHASFRKNAGIVSVLLLALALGLAAPALGAAPNGVVNVNTASVEQLIALPGIGESRARAIVAERKQRGGFRSLDELLEVKGIGEVALGKLKPHVVLSGKTTLAQP